MAPLCLDTDQSNLHAISRRDLSRGSAVYLKDYKTAEDWYQNPRIPTPSLFVNGILDWKNSMQTTLPAVSECAVHLELLEAFFHLRQRVLQSRSLEELLGIRPEPQTVYRRKWDYNVGGNVREAVQVQDKTFDSRRNEKWTFFLRLAAARFLTWAGVIENPTADAEPFSDGMPLPPLDVIMIWHALLLNPKWFRTFQWNKLENLDNLSRVHFPWARIHRCVDSESPHWPFTLPDKDAGWFRSNTNLQVDLFDYLTKGIKPEPLTSGLNLYGVLEGGKNRGLKPPDFPDLSTDQGDDPLDVKFVDICRSAADEDEIITRLVDAVERQAKFVDKMHNQLWIRSPAVEGTMNRSITRYARFVKLFKLYPQTMLVPTIDIDLVWHTHQASPAWYEAAMTTLAGRFINHDDTINSKSLGSGFSNTALLYHVRFGEEYQVCNCWDCEALLSAVSEKGDDPKVNFEVLGRQVKADLAYYRAVEIARMEGKTLLPIMTSTKSDS